nr:transposase [Pantoea ananatis]
MATSTPCWKEHFHNYPECRRSRSHYYNHRTQQYRQQTLSQEEMIGRYISHILAKHFKTLR